MGDTSSMQDTRDLIRSAPSAGAVRLGTRVVVERGTATAMQLTDLAPGAPLVLQAAKSCCELEIGGRVVARGRIDLRRGAAQFVCEELH